MIIMSEVRFSDKINTHNYKSFSVRIYMYFLTQHYCIDLFGYCHLLVGIIFIDCQVDGLQQHGELF